MISKVTFKNTEVYYSITGKGPVVVWLHGFMEDKSIWEGQLSVFNGLTTNICIDLLGHGKTGSVAKEHSMELQSQAVYAVLNDLKVGAYSLVGHSMGGYVSLRLLAVSSKNITHFVLLNSTSSPDNEEKKRNRRRALKIVAKQKDIYARLGVFNLFSKDSHQLYSCEIEELIKIAQKTTVAGISAALIGMMKRKSSEAVLKAYNGDKLIIVGEKDPVLLLGNSYKEAKLTDAHFEQLTGGHMSYLESKNQLNTVLKSFLNFN